MNKIPILNIDETPTEDLPIRILQAYRYNCDVLWSSSSIELCEYNPVIKRLNDIQRKRARILDRAIRKLQK